MRTLLQRNIRDRIMESLLVLSTIIVLLPLVIIIIHVVVNGISALNWEFFTEELGSPSRAIQGRPTGLVHTIIGTLVVDFMALIIAVPIGIGAGIMLSEYPDHKLNPTLRIMNDTLNGMPAILKGLLAFCTHCKTYGYIFRTGRWCCPGFCDASDYSPDNRKLTDGHSMVNS